MAQRQANEGAACERVWMRAALPGEVGEEPEAVAAGRHGIGPSQEHVVAGARRHRIAEPAQAAGRRQHDRHHVPSSRHGMAEGMDPPARVEERPIGAGEDDPRRPQRERGGAGRHRTDPDPIGRLVTAAGHDRRARPQPGLGRRCIGHAPGHLRPFEGARQPGRRDAQRLQHDRGPVARRQVEQQRAGRIGLVDRMLAGQLEANVVLGQQHMGDPRPHLRLVLADPEQLRRREAGQRVVAGDLDQPLRPDRLADRVAFRGRALVVPQDGGAQHRVGGVQDDGPVHLSGEPNPLDLLRPRPCLAEHGPNRCHRAGPPVARILLAPQRPGGGQAVGGLADAAHHAVAIDQDGLGGGGRDVEPEDEAHGRQVVSLRRRRPRRWPRCAR